MNLQNNFTRTNRNLRQVLEKWDKKCTPGGCFCCPPEWEKAGTAAYPYVLFFKPGPYT